MKVELSSSSLYSDSILGKVVGGARSHAPTSVLGLAALAVATVVLLLASLVGYVYFLTTIYPVYFSPFRNLPGPKSRPFFGNLIEMTSQPGAQTEMEWTRKYGAEGRFKSTFLFGRKAVHFLRPKALRQILVEDPYSYPKPTIAWKLLGLVAGYGLLTVEDDTHKKMRKTMNPAFSLTNLIEQFPVYYDKTYPLIDIMKKEVAKSPEEYATLDCDAYVNKALLDIICLTAFGYDADSVNNPNNELASAYHMVTSMQNGKNQARLAVILNLPFGDRVLDWASDVSGWESMLPLFGPDHGLRMLFQMLNAMHRIKKVAKEILYKQLRSGERAAQGGGAKAIIDIIEETYLSENDGKAKSLKQAERDMITQVLTFLGAGHETTASGVSWTLWNLASHPEAQDRLRAECKALIDTDARPPYSAIKGLAYLDAVINETMRLTPPVPRTVRQAKRSTYIDGLYVPAGTVLPISNRAINTNPDVWGADADEFKPERWFNLPADYDRTFSMITFIAGAHSCIGRTMSYLEMKAVVCLLVSNFRFEPISKDQSPHMDALITMKPRGGLPLRVYPV